MILCSAWALAHLAGKLRHTTGFARAQLHYVFLGAGLTAAGALDARRRRAARHRILAARRVRALLHATLARVHRPLHRPVPAHGRAGRHQPVRGLRGGLAADGGPADRRRGPPRRVLPRSEPDTLAGRRRGAGPRCLRPVPRVRAAHAPSRRPVPVPARLRHPRPRPRGKPGHGHLRRPRAGGDRHGGPDRPGPPSREPRHPRADPGPRRLCASRRPARRPDRRVARGAGARDEPARPGAVGRDGRARLGSCRGSAWQRTTRAPCSRTSGPGVPRRPCRSGTAG